jgi:hypothetical protein
MYHDTMIDNIYEVTNKRIQASKYIKSDKAQMVTELENYFTTWDKEQQVWQVAVTELGRSIKVDQSDIQKFIHVGDITR